MFAESSEGEVEGAGVEVSDFAVGPERGEDLGGESFFEEGEVFVVGREEGGERAIGFVCHTRKGSVKEEEVGLWGLLVFLAEVEVSGFEGGEVALEGEFAIDDGGVVVVGAPEVVDMGGVDAAGEGEGEQGGRGVGMDEHGDGARALGGFTGGQAGIASDVGGDHEGELFGVLLDPGEGGLKGGSGAVAGVLDVEGTALVRESKEPMYEDRNGLGVIDPALGADDAQADALAREGVTLQEAVGGLRGEGDGIFAGGTDSHLVAPKAAQVLLGIDATRPSERLQGKVMVRKGNIEIEDSCEMICLRHDFLL